MITAFKPYPKYKDSGVEWLGEVPEHWDVVRLGSLLRERGETNDEGHVTEVLSVLRNRGVIPYSEKGNIGNKKSEDITRYKIVRPGDIVVNCMNVIIGSVGISRYLVRIGNGILAHRMRIPMELLKCELLPRPPTEEQTAIVRFLDWAERRIRRVIRARQRRIKLLEEYKQALINQAVTGRIDVRTGKPYPKYKDSGVEWLGEVPEHWKELPLKRIATFDNSGSYGAEPEVGEVVMPVATTAQIDSDGQFLVDRMPLRGFTREEAGRYCCNSGDILVVKSSGSIFNVVTGKAGIVGPDTPVFVFSNFLMRVVPKARTVEPLFLYRLLSGWLTRERVKRMVTGTTYPNLRVNGYISALLPVPSFPEQTAIVEFLDEQTARIDAAIAADRRAIDLLEEFRTRLIADVVTGKLDVREAAAKLPDEETAEDGETGSETDPETVSEETLS